MNRISITACALVAGSWTLGADEPGAKDAPSDELFLLFNTPVISAGRMPQKAVQAPAKIVTVTARMIRQRGYLDLEDILHDLAGFDFNRVMGVEYSTVFMRGYRSANSDRFLLIWDGIVQNDLWKQNANISRQYPLVNVDRIEVLYGPASLMYGPNAFNGIINVILKADALASGVSGQIVRGSFQANLAELHVATDSGTWRGHVTARRFTGNEDHLDGKFWVDQAGRQRRYSLRFRPGRPDHDFVEPTDPKYALDVQDGRLHYQRLGQRMAFREGFSHDSHDWFIQGGIGYGDWDLRFQSWKILEDQGAWHTAQNLLDSQRELTANAVYLTRKQDLTESLKVESQLALRTSGQFDQDGTPRPSVYFTNSVTDARELKAYAIGDSAAKILVREYRASQVFTHQKSPMNVTFGWDYSLTYQHENYAIYNPTTNQYSSSPKHTERNVGIFGHVQSEIQPWLTLAAGLRRDYNDVIGEKGGFGHHTTPRLSAIFTISAEHYVKIIHGESFQAPPAQQKFSVVPGVREIASPGLQPERLKSLEVMYGYRPSARWYSTLNLFENQIDSFITSITVPFGTGTTAKFVNQGSLLVRGVELESQCSFSMDSVVSFNCTVVSAKDPVSGRKTGDIAPFKANVGWDHRSGAWSFSVKARYVSGRDTVNWDSKSIYVVRRVDAYLTVDASLALLGFWHGADLRLNIQNLMNREYHDPGPRSADGKIYNGSILQPPRRIMLGLGWKF